MLLTVKITFCVVIYVLIGNRIEIVHDSQRRTYVRIFARQS